MKQILGLVLIGIGICLGLYCGVWWAFIGGIVGVIEQIKAADVDALIVALNIARIFSAGLIGFACGLVFVIPGTVMIKDW